MKVPPMFDLASDRPEVSDAPDGRISFRPSSLGNCIRSLVASYQGIQGDPFDSKTLSIMKQGHIQEPHIAYDIKEEFGGTIQRQIQLRALMGNWGSLDGTCDGLWFADPEELDHTLYITKNDGPWFDKYSVRYTRTYASVGKSPSVYGVEIKCVGDSVFKEMAKNGPSQRYKMQISCYWMMLEETLGITLNGFIFAMGNRSDGSRNFQWINEPYYSREEITNRCLRIVENLMEPVSSPNSISCDTADRFGCRYWMIHENDSIYREDMEEFSKSPSRYKKYEFDPDLKNLLLKYHIANKKLTSAKEEVDALREKIDIARRNRPKVATPGFRIYTSCRTFVSEEELLSAHPEYKEAYKKFDLEACVKDNPDVAKMFMKESDPYLTIRANEKELEKIIKDHGGSLEELEKVVSKEKDNLVYRDTSAQSTEGTIEEDEAMFRKLFNEE